jgi:hypothetical protein
MVSFSQSASCSGGAASGVEGALSGIANIFGLGSLVSAIPGMDDEQDEQNKLSAAQANLAKVTSQWQATITNEKIKIAEPVRGFTERDRNSKAILNTDMDSLLKYKIQKRKINLIYKLS